MADPQRVLKVERVEGRKDFTCCPLHHISGSGQEGQVSREKGSNGPGPSQVSGGETVSLVSQRTCFEGPKPEGPIQWARTALVSFPTVAPLSSSQSSA